MTRQQLVDQILQKRSFLCIGLDTDREKIPEAIQDAEDPVFEFNKQIIDATKDLCVAYKPNLAFYEAQGEAGWRSLRKTLEYIPKDIFTIADAKRGDIGNTSRLYAHAFFEELGSDSITVAPYMGRDSVTPFLTYANKWVILLGITSNPGADDFELLSTGKRCLFEEVLIKSQDWGTPENMMYVVGATRPELFRKVRAIVPDHFLLVPGIGAQGGALVGVCEEGMNDNCGILVNASRSIIYAGTCQDFADKARNAALEVQQEMAEILTTKGL